MEFLVSISFSKYIIFILRGLENWAGFCPLAFNVFGSSILAGGMHVSIHSIHSFMDLLLNFYHGKEGGRGMND